MNRASFFQIQIRVRALASMLCLAPALFLPSTAEPAQPRNPQPELVREVSEGKREEACASWWGFNPVDSTASLQAAIHSGAKRLTVENLGAPWVVDRMQLASDQEIVFQPGVVVLAKRGSFKGSSDALFSASLKKNIILTGPGATLKMWKGDYDDPNQYKHAEWRHVLSFHSCSGVRITGLTLADSGGDGIYLGVARKGVPCSDVVIRDVICQNNYRQGISVISANNLLIENTLLKDTWGTAPQAGIDFEPNDPSEELVNCVMRNCVSEGNRGDAYVLYLRPLRADSKPVSVRVENCRSLGGRASARVVTGNDSESSGVKGRIEFVNCRFERSEESAIVVRDKPATGARVAFTDCQVVQPAAAKAALAPILLSSSANGVDSMGNIHFGNCMVVDSVDRLPMAYQDMSGGVGLREVTGTLLVERGAQRTSHTLTKELVAEWMPHRSFKQIGRFETKGLGFEPLQPAAIPRKQTQSRAKQRGLSEWLLWAEAGKKAAFTVHVRTVGKAEPKPAAVSVVAPTGKLTKLPPAEAGEEISYDFTAEETGAHKIVCEPQSFTASVHSETNPVCLYSESSSIHFLGTTGEFFFWVPPGTKEFAVRISGENDSERVKAGLFDPEGNRVEERDNIAQACQFVAVPRNPDMGEIWSLRLGKPATGVLEDFHVRLQGVPPVLAIAKDCLLKPVR